MAITSEPSDLGSQKLREFSARLAERLRRAPTQSAEPTRLAVRIANEGFLVDMSDVAEIVPLPNFAPVPWTKPWYRGLANVRGRLIGVVDLQHLATGTPLLPDQTQQVLVLSQVLQVNVGLLITRAFGIRNLKDIEPLAAVSAASQPWLGQHYRDLDGSTLIELNLRDLLAVAEFSVIGV